MPEQDDERLGRALRASRPAPSSDYGTRLRRRLTALDARTRRPDRLWTLVVAYACSGLLVLIFAAVAGAAPRPFMTGFADGIYENPATANVWFDRTVAAGARFVLLPVDWASVSPAQPPAGSGPSNPAYNWGTLDQAVRAATAHGLTVAFTVAGGGGGPAWADGPHRPRGVQPGTWRPNAQALGAFAQVLARRYSGSFNPGTGTLPHVRYYQGWSEPNLDNHLTPQWSRVRHHWVAESPIIYRGLLNAFYAGVKSVDRSDVVITGGTAPFGDTPGGKRVPPAEFVRDMLCLHGHGLTPQRCPDPAHFDILAHHPYALGAPGIHAFNADDASVPDIGRLTRALHKAERTGRVLPAGRKRVWVTEFSWDSNPPDPQGVPALTRARWMDEAFYILWRQGVEAIAWFELADAPPVPSYASTYQAGIYLLGGARKPDFEAFRFPFVVEPAANGRKVVWGISPDSGTVNVQRRQGSRWLTFASFNVKAHGVFTRTVSLPGRPLTRAQVGGETSLAWQTR